MRFRLTIDRVQRYVVEITAGSPEEAVKTAIENAEFLEPEQTSVLVDKIENLTPPSPGQLQAALELLAQSDIHPMKKHAQALSIYQDIKKVLALHDGEEGAPTPEQRQQLERLAENVVRETLQPPPELL